ncbi:jg17771 [Pararge aegeria aegeria]|uniref:Jg17771 protein n=1 Tax=Pararge aegeria aegeria TaxID=348720 RepID=A0A8S4RAD3_9NEOP|nr:jg17771 [Pararge aegeria aegeria]
MPLPLNYHTSPLNNALAKFRVAKRVDEEQQRRVAATAEAANSYLLCGGASRNWAERNEQVAALLPGASPEAQTSRTF